MTQNLDRALEGYESSSKKSVVNAARILGFGAAAAGGLLTCGQVDADIVNTGPAAGLPGVLPAGYSAGIDIDQDGDFDIAFAHLSNPGFAIIPVASTTGTANAEAAGAFLVGGATGAYNFPLQMASGDIVSAGAGTFQGTGTGWMGWASAATAGVTDPWGILSNAPGTVTGFIGLEFFGQTASGGEGTVYGWIQVAAFVNPSTTDADGFTPGGFALLDMAYENMGNSIAAGDVGVPEPGTAGAIVLTTLAMGATGLRRRRKNKSAA